jgi:ribosomal protein S18 acetylase RimI-like enzyme
MTMALIRPLVSDEEARACARMMADSEPWKTLGRTYDMCIERMRDDTKERYVALAEDGRPAGFVIVNMAGAFVGYIQTVCVAADMRGQGVGARLLRFAEERVYRDSPNVFMCVSSFNDRARRLYERVGYQVVGELTDYLVRGHSEILMRKSLGSLDEFYRGELKNL